MVGILIGGMVGMLIGGNDGMLTGGTVGTVMLAHAPANTNVAIAATKTRLNATICPPLCPGEVDGPALPSPT
jgi:hypothetical protein